MHGENCIAGFWKRGPTHFPALNSTEPELLHLYLITGQWLLFPLHYFSAAVAPLREAALFALEIRALSSTAIKTGPVI